MLLLLANTLLHQEVQKALTHALLVVQLEFVRFLFFFAYRYNRRRLVVQKELVHCIVILDVQELQQQVSTLKTRVKQLEEELELLQRTSAEERATHEARAQEDKSKLKTLAKHYQIVSKAKESLEAQIAGKTQ